MSKTLHEFIEVVEAGYEFLLAYAAQGRESDGGAGGSEVRTTLTKMAEAAAGISKILANNEAEVFDCCD